MNVTFLAPDIEGSDGFYDTLTDILQAAATQLDVAVEVINCQRQRERMIEQAVALTTRPARPDYVLLVNYMTAAPEIMPAFDAAGIGVFFVVEGMTGAEATPLGNPRRKHASWLGEIVPDDVSAGYLLSQALTDAARNKHMAGADGLIHVGVLSGEHTPAGNARFRGWLDLKGQCTDIAQDDFQYGEWREDVARRVTALMLKRHPGMRVIWCANDAMALGAMAAVCEIGKTPGKDILLGGVDLGARALAGVADGSLAVSVGGHVTDGARALVLLYDHHATKTLPPASRRTHLVAVGADDAPGYLRFMREKAWHGVDFVRFSRARNPDADETALSLEALVKG